MIFINASPRNSLKIFQPFLPVFIPVGIGYLMAMLHRNGIRSICFDEQIETDILQKIDKAVVSFEKPYIFGFSVLTASLKNALNLAELLKQKYPGCIVIFGGIHPTAMPEEVLGYNQVDIAVRGEAENSITELYSCLKQGHNISHIESISYREGNAIVHNKRSEVISNLDSLAPFPYEWFSHKSYDTGFIMSSRGCPHNCIFCSNKINSCRKFRYRNADTVVTDLIMLHEKYKRRYVYFIDDNLLANRKRIIELANKISQSRIAGKMIYNFQARGDNCDPEVLEILFDAGFKGVYFGIETASEKIMKSLNKGETVAQVVEAIQMAKKAGYHVSANFIFGLPGETHHDRIDAIALTRKLQLDLVKYNNATPYPGTELYDIAWQQQRLNLQDYYENINSVSTFIENPFRKIPFAYVPPQNTENEIRHDILHGYFSFYFSYSKLKGVFTRPDLNNAWFDFGHSFGDFLKKLPATVTLLFFLSIKFGGFLLRLIAKKMSITHKPEAS